MQPAFGVALIVGAGDFIGAAIARRFAAGGFTVALGRRGGEKLAPLVDENRAAGGKRTATRSTREKRRAWKKRSPRSSATSARSRSSFNVGANVNYGVVAPWRLVRTAPVSA